jgi:hypothetical protein
LTPTAKFRLHESLFRTIELGAEIRADSPKGDRTTETLTVQRDSLLVRYPRYMALVLAHDHSKQQQILALGRLGWTLSRIQQTTDVRRETISGYLKAAGIPVRGRGRPSESKTKPAISGRQVSTDSGPSKPGHFRGGVHRLGATTSGHQDGAVHGLGRGPTSGPCAERERVRTVSRADQRNARARAQRDGDLAGPRGRPRLHARYASVRRFVVTLRGTAAPEARFVITTAPGEEGQVDYGDGPMVRHPQTGKYRRTRLFVLTLGYSRKAVRLLVWQSSTQVWAELHERAFRRLDGTVRVIVLDNLKEGVLTPDIYDPALNPLYRDVLAHYGVVALPCRVGGPDRKGKVEAGVGHA